MAHFSDELNQTCEDLVQSSAEDSDLCTRIRDVARCAEGKVGTDSKRFLADVKQILQSTKSLPDRTLSLKFLVLLYLSIGNRNAAKKVLSSHLQGLPSPQKAVVLELLCQRVEEHCQTMVGEDASQQSDIRHLVDMLAALMDNFALGETCVTAKASSAMAFLARAQHYFFQLFCRGGQSAVQTNAVMHDCHVTMQALNRLLQRHLAGKAAVLVATSDEESTMLASLMRLDILIVSEEQMMMDCRCCCAINLVLLLQMFAPGFVPQCVRQCLGVERPEEWLTSPHPSWLSDPLPQLSSLTLPSLPPLAALALLWGLLSMLDSRTLTLTLTPTLTQAMTLTTAEGGEGRCRDEGSLVEKKNTTSAETKKVGGGGGDGGGGDGGGGNGVGGDKEEEEGPTGEEEGEEGGCLALEALLAALLGVDERCQSTVSRVQSIKTLTLWTVRALGCLKGTPAWPPVRHRLQGEGHSLQQLFSFVWTHWTDQLDVIRQNSRIIFDNCLKIHTLASQCDDVGSNPFLRSLLRHTLAMDWGTLCKFSTLSSLVRLLGATPLLLHHPHFPSTLLQQMADQAMACHASELYEVLIDSVKERSGARGQSDSERGGARGQSDSERGGARGQSDSERGGTRGQSDSERGGARGQSDSERGGARGQSDSERGGARGQSDIDGQVYWLSVWIDPIIRQLCSANQKLKQHIIEYILPKVMKKDKVVLEYMLNKLSCAEETGVEPLGALIVCLRRARAWGLLTEALHTQPSTAPVWTKVRAALSSSEEQVRLDAFALLCENKRTAEPVRQVEFDHIRHFLSHNLNNQTPAFRQAMMAFCKKLFFRVNESQQAMLRQVKRKQNVPKCTAALQKYSRFLSWLEGFLFSQLYPSSAMARCTVSLALLSMLTSQVLGDKDDGGYSPLMEVTVNHIHTLLECVTDTFEENKEQALSLLCVCTSMHPALLTEQMGRELYASALTLAVSTRPQDCGTAAYLFKLLLRQTFVGSLLRSWDHHHHCHHRCHVEKVPSPYAQSSNNMDPDLSQLMSQLTMSDSDSDSDDLSATLCLLRSLLTLVVSQVAVARSSLILAAANRPIYPTMHCIRYILDGVDFQSLKEGEKPAWTRFVDSLLHVCLHVASVVSPVVQNSSPEGNIPEEAILGPGLKFDLGLMSAVEESRQTVALMPEYLVVCCWRSVKEVSLLLGQLCLHLPVTQPGVDQGLLSFQQMEQVGVYFKQQLMESLHRGAFELAYTGFLLMCQRLWKSPWSELQTLPRRWLQEVMTAVMAAQDSSALCATRRSAGLPFFIQAIVATETASSGRPSFHTAVGQLLTVALTSDPSASQAGASTDAQVHALNILRALFKDTRLGEDVAVYIADGLKAAILGFKSQYWEVRNSATLLLSALMTRIFGVKRSKDESVLSKRNSQTGRAFFHKYPALYPFLLAELEMATQDLGGSGRLQLHPSLYPVLMVLGRLFPSTMENTSTRLNLAAFIPHIIRCSSSAVYKTRMMAARALQPLVGREQLTSVLTSLMTSLPSRPSPPPSSEAGAATTTITTITTATVTALSHSHIHGLLLQVHQLTCLSSDVSGSTLHTLMSVCLAGWLPVVWLITRHNGCPCTRKVALEVTDLILSNAAPVFSSLPARQQDNHCAIRQRLLDVLASELCSSPSSLPYHPHIPFLSELLSCVARLALSYLGAGRVGEEEEEKGEGKKKEEREEEEEEGGKEDSEEKGKNKLEGEEEGKERVVLRLLEFSAYEVHLAVLDWLLDRCTPGGRTKTASLLVALRSDEASSDNSNLATTTTTAATATAVQGKKDVTVSDPGESRGQGVAMTTTVANRLLTMGLEEGAHPETVVKIFQLLSLPAAHRCLGGHATHSTVFEQLLGKVRRERRTDAKAALIQFMGSLLPYLHQDLQQDRDSRSGTGRTLRLLQEWSGVLCGGCEREQPEDLQLSCATVLRDHWRSLLVDKDNCLGLLVFEFWSCLVTLLQAEDLDVKDVVASVTTKLGLNDAGGSHPEEALGQLVGAMFGLHGNSKLWDCVLCALSWMMPRATDVDVSGTERLFNKGELNTFQDSVHLARVVSHCLKRVFSSHSTRHSDGENAGNFSPHQTHGTEGGEEKSPGNLAPHQTRSPENFASHTHEIQSAQGRAEKSPPNLFSSQTGFHKEPKSQREWLVIGNDDRDLGQSSSSSSFPLWPEDGGQEKLTAMLREAVDVLEKTFGTSKAQGCSLETVFLKGSSYCERTVFLIRLALVVHNLQSLPGLWSQCGEGVRKAYGRVRGWLAGEATRCHSCNVLLGTLVDTGSDF